MGFSFCFSSIAHNPKGIVFMAEVNRGNSEQMKWNKSKIYMEKCEQGALH